MHPRAAEPCPDHRKRCCRTAAIVESAYCSSTMSCSAPTHTKPHQRRYPLAVPLACAQWFACTWVPQPYIAVHVTTGNNSTVRRPCHAQHPVFVALHMAVVVTTEQKQQRQDVMYVRVLDGGDMKHTCMQYHCESGIARCSWHAPCLCRLPTATGELIQNSVQSAAPIWLMQLLLRQLPQRLTNTAFCKQTLHHLLDPSTPPLFSLQPPPLFSAYDQTAAPAKQLMTTLAYQQQLLLLQPSPLTLHSNSGSCVFKSQNRSVVSPDPVASRLPSGLKATTSTDSE